MAPIRLCALGDLPEGRARGFDPAGTGRDTMFVVRRDGRLYAYRDECPHHAGAAMAWRRHAYLDAAGTAIQCHGHGALFEIETGLCTLGPCVGRRLAPVRLAVEDGEVFLAPPAPGRAA